MIGMSVLNEADPLGLSRDEASAVAESTCEEDLGIAIIAFIFNSLSIPEDFFFINACFRLRFVLENCLRHFGTKSLSSQKVGIF